MVFTKITCTSSDSTLEVSLAQGSVGAAQGRQAAQFPGQSFSQTSKRARTGPFCVKKEIRKAGTQLFFFFFLRNRVRSRREKPSVSCPVAVD